MRKLRTNEPVWEVMAARGLKRRGWPPLGVHVLDARLWGCRLLCCHLSEFLHVFSKPLLEFPFGSVEPFELHGLNCPRQMG
jgi:hypothetical protein